MTAPIISQQNPQTPGELGTKSLDGSFNNSVPAIAYPAHFTWLQSFTDFMEKERIFLAFAMQIAGVIKIGERITLFSRVVVEPYATLPRGGWMSMGHLSYSHSRLGQSTRIGRYTSIAPDVKVIGNAHPINWVTTSGIIYGLKHSAMIRQEINPHHPSLSFDEQPKPITIGNDVWIGEGALLKGGITIGDGAVIGARSIVTKDVPSYSISAGNPARVRRLRFNERIVERLIALRWWDIDLSPIAPAWSDVERFIGDIEEGVSAGVLQPLKLKQIDLATAFTELCTAGSA